MTKAPLKLNTIYNVPYEKGILSVPDASVDLILTDPPYGVTACDWDKKPDLTFMWKEFNRILKERGVALITATQPFATEVINANRKAFRYDLIWAKSNPVGFLNAKRMPLRQHELILVFYRKLPVYNPQMIPGETRITKGNSQKIKPGVYASYKSIASMSHERYPTSLLPFEKDGAGGMRHPTQKPLSLFEYLIKTYSIPGGLIFDPFSGSGTTLAAAKNVNRKYFGFEIEEKYYLMAHKRLSQYCGGEPITVLR